MKKGNSKQTTKQETKGQKSPSLNQENPTATKPELPLIHKTLIQWEENVTNSGFPYSYIYNYNYNEERGEISVTLPFKGYKCEIYFKFGRSLPYIFMVNDKEQFVCDKLKDIMNWLDGKEAQYLMENE